MIRKIAATTAEVVAEPTASAPPLTSKPRWQPIPAMITAKNPDLIRLVTRSIMLRLVWVSFK